MTIPAGATAGKFRKTTIVEAFVWNPEDHFFPQWFLDARRATVNIDGVEYVRIKRLWKDDLYVAPGGWIIHDSAEVTSCTPDIFEASYEAVETDT